MHIHNFLFSVVFSLFSLVFSDEDYSQFTGCCTYKGPDLKDIEYIIYTYFNKKLMMQYNSTRGNWKGFTAFAIEEVKYWNSDPQDAVQRAFEFEILCKNNIDLVRQVDSAVTSKPEIKLNSVKQPSYKHHSMLVCSAYNFYPKQIRLTWLRDGQEVTSAISFSEAMPDGDFYYQIHSYLEYTPTKGEKITCMVEHLSLSEPVLQDWDPSLPASQQIQIILGVCGLMLGFVFITSGFIYYKKKFAAYITFTQGRVMLAVEDLPEAGA